MKGPKTIVAIGAVLTGIACFVVRFVPQRNDDPLAQGATAYRREDWAAAEARARLALKTNFSDRARSQAARSHVGAARARRIGRGDLQAPRNQVHGGRRLLLARTWPAPARPGRSGPRLPGRGT